MEAIARFVRIVDSVNERVGRAVAWLTLAMVLITFLVVILRYVFALGWVAMQESYVWLHGIVFMGGAGYTLLHDGHVRVDIFYRPRDARHKALVDLLGSLFLLLPIIVMVAVISWPYVLDSWLTLEGSREAGGLQGLFLLKSFLLVYSLLMGLQGLSMMGRSLLTLRGHPLPPVGDGEEELL